MQHISRVGPSDDYVDDSVDIYIETSQPLGGTYDKLDSDNDIDQIIYQDTTELNVMTNDVVLSTIRLAGQSAKLAIKTGEHSSPIDA